jgi:hypothetical protein
METVLTYNVIWKKQNVENLGTRTWSLATRYMFPILRVTYIHGNFPDRYPPL